MHVQYNDTVKLENDTVNDTVFDLIKENKEYGDISVTFYK